MSSGNLLDKLAAAEGHNRILVSRCPSFGVAVDEGNVSRDGDIVHAALEQALILVLAVDDADGAVFLHEGDREELTFGLCDQVVEFGLHSFDFVGGEIVRFFADGFKLFLVFFLVDCFNEDCDDDGENANEDEGDEDSSGEVLSQVHLVCGVR